MSKKVMILTGSPRKGGNTAVVSNWVAEGARDAGAEVETIDVARLEYKTNGCTACNGCKQTELFKCIIKDEASEILSRMPEQDAIVFATPVYFMGFSAQIKLLLDRMYSLIRIDEAGKIEHKLHKPVIALIATAGGDEGSGINLVKSNIDAVAGFLGKPAKKFAVPFAPSEPGEIETNVELKEKAMAFGSELAK